MGEVTALEAIRKLMEAHGLSQGKIARHVGRQQAAVSMITTKRMAVKPWFIDAVCDLTGVDAVHRRQLHVMGAKEQGWGVE